MYIISLITAMGKNFALQSVATHILSHARCAAKHAIYGNDDAHFWNKCCFATLWEKSPWWKVTFAELISVREVMINRNNWLSEYMASY